MRRLVMIGLWAVLVAGVGVMACGSPRVTDIGGGGGGDDDDGSTTHHPVGFAASDVHGAALKVQSEDCRACHGANLEGGTAVSCDSCHVATWRTDCTYCHGGSANQTGAPPRDLDGETDPALGSFPPHTAHVAAATNHAAYDCVQCHTKPTDVMSNGHVFDGTKGRADVDFGAGLSAAGTYNAGTAGCSTLYCHGNGVQANGSINSGAAAPGCNDCHRDQVNDNMWNQLSGEHQLHLQITAGGAVTCNECHSTVVAGGTGGNNGTNPTIASAALHVNGQPDNAFGGTNVAYNGMTCTGTCHGRTHNGDAW